MTLAQFRRIVNNYEELRRRPRNIGSGELAGLASQLGRKKRKKRSGEPMYVAGVEAEPLANTRAYGIPSHPGNLGVGLAKKILGFIELDIARWQDWFESHGGNGDA